MQATTFDPAGPFLTLLSPDAQTIQWKNYLTQWTEPVIRRVTASIEKPMLIAVPVYAAALVLAGLALLWVGRGKAGAASIGAIALACVSFGAAALAFPIKTEVKLPGQTTPDAEAAHLVISGLLNNVSTAMLANDDAGFAAALAPFVSRMHTIEVGAEIKRGLSVSLPSGARARTDGIVNLRVEQISASNRQPNYQILATWTAQVSGGHWGHMHRRAITYRGLVDILHEGEVWVLDGLTILSAQPAS